MKIPKNTFRETKFYHTKEYFFTFFIYVWDDNKVTTVSVFLSKASWNGPDAAPYVSQCGEAWSILFIVWRLNLYKKVFGIPAHPFEVRKILCGRCRLDMWPRDSNRTVGRLTGENTVSWVGLVCRWALILSCKDAQVALKSPVCHTSLSSQVLGWPYARVHKQLRG